MPDDRELVERLAAIDATPRAGWVAELRADLDAAWNTGELPSRHAPSREPSRRWPTRTWLVASVSFAAVAILIVALVVVPRTRDDVDTPSYTAPLVSTTSTTSESTSTSTVPPAPGAVVVTSAGRIEQTGNDGSFVFSADGSTLALAGEGYGLRLYDPDTLTMERELGCPTTTVQTPDVTSFTWNPQVAATWDTAGQTLLTDLIWASRPVGCEVVFSADGSRAARGEEYRTYDKISDVRTLLWNTTDGTLVGALEGGWPLFSLDGTRIITRVMGTAGVMGGARVWDTATGRLLSEFDIGQVFAPPVLSADRTRVLIAGQLRGTVLDARTFDPIVDVSFPERASTGPGAINHDGTLIASTNGNTVSVWEVASAALVQTLQMDPHLVAGGDFAISDVEFSPNGLQLMATKGVAASVWDLTTGEEVFTIEDDPGSIISPTFSPDGALLAIATIGNQPKLFDTATGEQLNESESSISPFGFIAFSPDGRTLAEDSGAALDLWTYARR
jgi:WD40 repeat protein